MKHLIESFAAGGPALVKAIEGLGREELLARPVAGTWSIQEIVLHLMDSDLIGVDRMKRIAAEERPLLIGYDENAFVRELGYDLIAAGKAAGVFAVNRELFAVQLAGFSAERFERAGVHNEIGLVTLGKMLGKYVGHLEHHLGFIHRKRAMLGR